MFFLSLFYRCRCTLRIQLGSWQDEKNLFILILASSSIVVAARRCPFFRSFGFLVFSVKYKIFAVSRGGKLSHVNRMAMVAAWRLSSCTQHNPPAANVEIDSKFFFSGPKSIWS